jgi:predicted phosphodiesterase
VRVAALYDVHGNLPALEAVVADVADEDVDAVVVGGDVVSGPFPVETFDLLTALPVSRFVRGNGDRLVLERDEGRGAAWCAARLGPERLARLATWPLTLELDLDGLGRAVFCHATPRLDDEIVTRITPDQELAAAFPGVALAVVGHTHIQFDRRVGPLRVVNAGSVGMPYEGRRGAFWSLLGQDVEQRWTPYDADAAADRIRAVGSPTGDELIGSLLDPPHPDEVSTVFEARRGP